MFVMLVACLLRKSVQITRCFPDGGSERASQVHHMMWGRRQGIKCRDNTVYFSPARIEIVLFSGSDENDTFIFLRHCLPIIIGIATGLDMKYDSEIYHSSSCEVSSAFDNLSI